MHITFVNTRYLTHLKTKTKTTHLLLVGKWTFKTKLSFRKLN